MFCSCFYLEIRILYFVHMSCISIFLFQDFDFDGKVSKQDFTEAVVSDDMLLEILGICLPIREVNPPLNRHSF